MKQTVEEIICQSCGMRMAAAEHFGTNSNNSPSEDYCCFCCQNGGFTSDATMLQTIESNLSYLDGTETIHGHTLTKSEAALRMLVLLPTLKRWQQHELTHKEYFKAVNRAVDYISEHLSAPINLYDLAVEVNISGFHFHRIFKAMMSESPGEYIQRLRFERAVFKLQTTKQTVAEIAEQTGYQSPHALTKAFKKRFGIPPAAFRARPSELSVSIEPIGNMELIPQIREIDSKVVVTTRVDNPYEKADAFTRAWKKLITFMNLDGIPDGNREYLSLSRDVSSITRPELCRMYVCISNTEGIKPKGEFGVQTIEGGLYAIFKHKGAYDDLDKLYCNIYRNWIPYSEYELRDIAFFEKYMNSPDTVSDEELITEVYIPIVPIRK